MRYLITGGAGFIGSNFARRLARRKEQVIILDNLSRPGASFNLARLRHSEPNISFVKADVCTDQELLGRLVEQVDVVYHLAAQVGVTSAVSNPRYDFEVNALGTLNLLEAVRKSGAQPQMIFASTNKVYGPLADRAYGISKCCGDLGQVAIAESQPIDLYSPYGCSKGAADQYVRDYARIYGLKTAVIRQSCIYGPGQLGSEEQGWVAWFVIATILGKAITIYGDGNQIRDLLYVDDLFDLWDRVTGCASVLNGEVFNIGGGRLNCSSLVEMIRRISKRLNMSPQISYAKLRPGDQAVYVSDLTKSQAMLDWAPSISIEHGLESLISWILTNRAVFERIYSDKPIYPSIAPVSAASAA